MFHDHERARELIQSAQAGSTSTRPATRATSTGSSTTSPTFERSWARSSPTTASTTAPGGLRRAATPTASGQSSSSRRPSASIISTSTRYRESVSIIITTNDREARLHPQRASRTPAARRSSRRSSAINTSAGLMVAASCGCSNERLLRALRAGDRGHGRRFVGLIFIARPWPTLIWADRTGSSPRSCAGPSR